MALCTLHFLHYKHSLPLLRARCVSDPQQEVKGSNCSTLARKPFLESAASTNTRNTVLSLWNLGAGGSPPGGPHPGDPRYMKEGL